MSTTEKRIVILDFSGIYEMENFYKEVSHSWVDLRGLSGCNCYCDDEAKEVICEKIKNYSAEGIHFIDSGNYHYMSRIWLGKINQPFRLLVFDNHTDMQPPAFGGILSCGGWIAAAVEELPCLEEVILVGPDEESIDQVEEHIKKKTKFLSREALQELIQEKKPETIKDFFKSIPADLPLYISVDKDVLCPDDASTTWSQGDMRLEDMQKYLQIVLESFEEQGQKIIGADICGECDIDQMMANEKNDRANDGLLKFFGR